MKLNRPDNWLHHLSGAALVLVLSLGTTWWLWQFETRNAELDQRSRMDASVQAFASRVEQRVRAQEQVLRGVRGLFSAGAAVGREAFARYVDALQLAADMAGLIGLGWAPLLNAAQMPELEDKMRSQGYSNYVSTPLGARSQYAPLVQRERSVEPSVRMLGQDMMAMPTTVLRWSVPAIWGGGQRDYRKTHARLGKWGRWPGSIRGVHTGLPGLHTRTGGVRIFDGIELSNQSLLFNSTPSRLTVVLVLADTLEYLQLAGRTWTLAMAEQADSPDAPAHHKA